MKELKKKVKEQEEEIKILREMNATSIEQEKKAQDKYER